MATSSDHFAAVFKNNCLIRPRHPQSQLPATTLDYSSNDDSEQSPLNENAHYRDDDELYTEQEEIYSPNKDSETINEADQHKNLSDLLGNNEKFYKHLQELRLENKKTLKMLERLYKSKEKFGGKSKINENDFIGNMVQEEKNEKTVKMVENVYNSIVDNEDESSYNDNILKSDEADNITSEHYSLWKNQEYFSDQSSYEIDEDPRFSWQRKFSNNILPDETEVFRGRPFSYEVIDNMWDNFSVENYAPKDNAMQIEPQSKHEWVPSVTIPEPFQMTLREAAKSKVKSKRKEKLEQELLKKRLEEESELNKKFKARPMPATTFMHRYKEIEAEEETKREYRKQLSKAILEVTQKPFDFMKREDSKKELRRSQSLERIHSAKSDTVNFKAKPFPADLFNLSLEDKRAEQEEYRRIKMKMRSQEMLAGSCLPPNMRARGQHYTINNRYTNKEPRKIQLKSQNFKPKINHDIPDFKEMQEKFETELIRRRKERTPTLCEPFSLHTAKVPVRRSNLYNSWNNERPSSEKDFFNTSSREFGKNTADGLRYSTPEKQKNANRSSYEDAPPFAFTETARLRHAKAQESLKNRTKSEELEKMKAQEKKRRENQIRKQVSKKSVANDMKYVLKKQNQDKLRSFKEADLARAKEYKQYLKEMKSRVDERPLLFEQESQTNAKRTAQRRYEQILKEAGVDDNIVSSLVTDDGRIVDAESDDDYDNIYENTYEEEADHSLPVDEFVNNDEGPGGFVNKTATADVSSVSIEDVSDVE